MNIIKILRPHQWVKNTFVFIPLFFGGSLFDAADWKASAIAFFAFCMAASTIYYKVRHTNDLAVSLLILLHLPNI